MDLSAERAPRNSGRLGLPAGCIRAAAVVTLIRIKFCWSLREL
jgi:hypothetical protein